MAEGSQTWFNYVPLSGVGPKINDDGSRVFCSVPILREAEGLPPVELAIIGDATKLDLVRVATPNTDGNLTQDERHKVGNILDHAILVLRLIFDSDIDRLCLAGKPIAIGQFGKEDGSPQLSLTAEEFRNPPHYDADEIRNAIVATAPIRVQLSLLAEAAHPATPPSFKYLCYYKILELELRQNRKWVGLVEHLKDYEQSFEKLKIGTARLTNFLHSYRDKCAHIKTGGRDELGLTGMGSIDAEVVGRFLPLLHKIVIDLLNRKYADRIHIQLAEPADWQPLEQAPIAGAQR
jgi:hypothetical protein